ncbi:atlastin-1-like [Folsomia candida]|uniref:atlastin-1-like n=1 Tax=Folsomia candida TaxID=158441 RepID=UPI0016051FA7|nr:atlastin-1-like [Folsomia candida]
MTNFAWRGGSERKTVGIDVWSEPFWTTDNGRRIAVILMDTQGSFDDQTTMQQNAIIFAISTLFSSVLIFNIKFDVGEDVLQFFQFFSSFATLTIPEVDGDAASGGRGTGAFQKLVFLIRDFQFIQDYKFGFYDDNLVPEGQKANYKKDKLDSNPGQPTEVRFTHDQVVKSYQDVGVYLMPEPDKGLKQYDKLDNLDPEFASHVGAFVPLMLSSGHLVTKKMGSVEVTGSEMIKYVNSWATLFEGNDLPEIKSVYHSAAESQFIIAKHLATTFYSSEMQKFILQNPDGVNDSELTTRHSDLLRESFTIYKSKSKLGGATMDAKFGEEFTTESDRLFDTYKSTNHTNLKAAEANEKLKKAQEDFDREVEAQKERAREQEQKQTRHRQRIEDEIEAGRKANQDLLNAIKAQKEEQERARAEARERDEAFRRQIEHERELARREPPPNPLEEIVRGVGRIFFPWAGMRRF